MVGVEGLDLHLGCTGVNPLNASSGLVGGSPHAEGVEGGVSSWAFPSLPGRERRWCTGGKG